MMRTIRNGFLSSFILGATWGAQVYGGEVLEITRDTVLDRHKSYGAIVIKASNLTIDGRSAWLIGPAAGKKEPRPDDFLGVAIRAEGVSNVRLLNINARGWETGLKIENGRGWLADGCDFSNNFHDPNFGWGENSRRGGIVLARVQSSTIRRCRANHVWDGCVLVDSSDNIIEDNDFSHTSNTAPRSFGPHAAIRSGATT